MRISRERLTAIAQAEGFQPDALEKAIRLLGLLGGISRHPFLRDRLALKGGTALNLFFFDLPRLSVDIDLNYIGAEDRETMLAERQQVIEATKAICIREGLTLRNMRDDHAGVALDLRYAGALGGQGSLKIDLNFITRIPLWPPERLTSHAIGGFQASAVLVMDLHELAAGKLAALLARRTSRDLFDAYELLVQGVPGHEIDPQKLRLAFTVYGAFNAVDWRTVSTGDIAAATNDLRTYLLPLLRTAPKGDTARDDWAEAMATACGDALKAVLPLSATELAFLDRLLVDGEIVGSLLTQDPDLASRIERHPALLWKSLNVKDFKRGVRRNAKKLPE